LIFTVAIPSPLRRGFDYLPAANSHQGERQIPVGTRVKVPFGKRTLVGIVIGCAENSSQPMHKLKAISEVIDQEPLVDEQLLQLYLWAADYYQHPVGDTLLSTLPALLRKGAPVPDHVCEHWQLSNLGLGLSETSLQRAKKQQQLVHLLREHHSLSSEELIEKGFSRVNIRALESRGLISKLFLPKALFSADKLLAEPGLSLRAEQQQALANIHLEGFQSYLLFGDTGTGKTEVYLQAIAEILKAGKQALVLVPEINLTPQTLTRFQRRFNCPVAPIHSGLSDRERLQSWADARSGIARIIIGTRSAIFTPLANPGIIILDEEHDPSFKQQDGFRYSARDVAVMRANREQIPVILGSATPSLETQLNSERGRYTSIELRDRGHHHPHPQWQLIDLKGTDLKAGFSAPLLKAMTAELGNGNQVLVFLNRRGYAPLLLCHDCGWQAECLHCSTKMTTHLRQNKLICHQCEQQQPLPSLCSQCHSANIHFVGQGTERSEEILEQLFPGTRIIRLDRDSTRNKNAMANAIEEIHRNKPCILVGTQMIAKGHHFPGVTLAALLEVDSGLFSTDFRAMERMAQMITQVAGRAGRGDQPGKVIIQSHYVDHPLLRELVKGDYRNFSKMLLADRRHQGLPPYSHMAIVRAEASNPKLAESYLNRARALLEKALPPSPDARYLGPLPATLERRKGFHRFVLSMFASNRRQLGDALTLMCQQLEADKDSRNLRWAVDIDPQESS